MNRLRLLRTALLIFVIHVVGMSLARAASQVYEANCKNLNLPATSLTTCVQSTQNKKVDPARIIYVFHGIFGNADFVNTRGVMVDLGESLRQQLGDKAPLIVGLSTGPQGILKTNALEVWTAILAFEQSTFGAPASARHLMGFSMGSHNSARLLAEVPGQFLSVSLLCPALMAIDPFDQAQVAADRARHRAYLNTSFFNVVIRVFEREFPTRAEWDANNPFQFLAQGRFDQNQFFVSTGRSDGLGFIEGATEFKTRSALRNITLQNQDVAGDHCRFDSKALFGFVKAQFKTAPSVVRN
jgi:pimeloyl-ACP methyl ester carboxylesterase